MLNINTKQLSFITFLIAYIFFIPHILTPSFAQETEKTSPMDLEVLLGETTSTPRGMSGGLKFQYEMAELLGERVGPDDSGNVHHAGGFQAFIQALRSSFPERESTDISITSCL